MTARLVIDDVTPVVDCGRLPSKAVVGECVPIEATVWREGHDALGATVVWEGPGVSGETRRRMVPHSQEPDRWSTTVVADREGLWSFHIEAWSDPWSTWRHAVEAKLAAGQGLADLANDLEAGARLLDQVATRHRYAAGPDQPVGQQLRRAATALRDDGLPLPERVRPALSSPVHRVMIDDPVRELVTTGKAHPVWVDRHRALFGSWYELFPRSTGGWNDDGRPAHGTFKTAAQDLPRIAGMGFDVVYLTPVHPIGLINRKGRNNVLSRGPDDVGSPWAIGSDEGGHDAVHPELGTIEDFDAYVAQAAEHGIEVAMDLALQCAPDHPWVRAHPEWFSTLPDGTIAYAENPPKKYQDIYPLNFDNDPQGLYAEVLRVVLHWVRHGVRIFRVDNPHTKPPDFWHWLISQVKSQYPDVLFLSEAFTRPARLYGLARLGFTQSYTYFTWRTSKEELTEFGRELVRHIDECRPNLFVNTQDILHASLQHGGPGMFAVRAALAATFSPNWGVYSGYELFEDQPLRPGSEEYLDSEKYQLRPRDYAAARAENRSLEPWLRRLNEIRRAHPALQQLRTLRFHEVTNQALLAYSKSDPETGDTVLCVVNLNPFGAEEGTLWVDQPAFGMDWGQPFRVVDEVTGERYHWVQANYVRLEPARAVAHILTVLH